MSRVTWHVFRILSVFSLLLCLAVCLLWVRSYSWTDRVFWRLNHVGWIESGRGSILIQVEQVDASSIPPNSFGLEHERRDTFSAPRLFYDLRGVSFPNPADTFIGHEWYGLSCYTLRDPTGTLIVEAIIPFWCMAIATAALPLARTITQLRRRFRARRRKSERLCISCGYDLRASPESCPECGLSVTRV